MSCLSCPIGSHCPSNGMFEPIACVNVTTAATVNKTNCDPCPAGHKCIDASKSPIPCEDGYYSKGWASECTLCPIGHR